MGKIVSIRNDSVIARTDDGQVKIIPKSGLDFEPVIGEEVEIITSGSKVILKQKSHETVKEFEQEIKQTAKNPEPNPSLTKSHSTPRGRIIGIQEGIVTIGKTDKSIQEVRIEDCNFQPNINDEVEIFSSANRTLVVKVKQASSNELSDRIIDICDDIISIGKANGDIQEVGINECNFEPNIGDEVEVFSKNEKTIVAKRLIILKKTEKPIPQNYTEKPSNQVHHTVGIYPVSKKAAVKKGRYVFLALFFGWCGFHKFYEGRILAGLGYLVVGFMPPLTIITFIIGVKDALQVIDLPTDGNGYVYV